MWRNFFIEKLPDILKENEVRYGDKYVVSYLNKSSEFFNDTNVIRNKNSITKDLTVDVKLTNLEPSADEFKELVFEDVPVMRIPILTDSGIIIRGTKYYYESEIKQSDGWYILDSEINQDASELVKISDGATSNDMYDFELDDYNEKPDESDYDTEDIMSELDSEINNATEDEDVSKEELDDEDSFMEEESLEDDIKVSYKEKDAKYRTSLLYRGPFARNMMFHIKKNKDGTSKFLVKFQNKRTRSVSWFVFLKALLPGLSSVEIMRKFSDFEIVSEAYASELHTYSLNNDKGIPSIEASSEECAAYCLKTFFLSRKGEEILRGIANPIEEFHRRLKGLRCDTSTRNTNIFSFCNLTGYVLQEDIEKNRNISKNDLNKVIASVGRLKVGDILDFEKLVVIDSCESIKYLRVSKVINSKSYEVEKPPVRDNFTDEILDLFKHYLLVCEGIGETFGLDNLRNKEIETIESRIETNIRKVLYNFNTSFMDTMYSMSVASKSSKFSESDFAPCFKANILKDYKKLLDSIRESSNYQSKDDTNALAEYCQKYSLKYGCKNAPLALRSVSEDQYGFICPQSTSEGSSVGLKLFRSSDTIIENKLLKREFYILENGVNTGKKVFLSVGEVWRSLYIKHTEKLPTDINTKVTCLKGSRTFKAKLRNVQYMEVGDCPHVSIMLGSVPGENNDGGKRGVMISNNSRQCQPFIVPSRQMVDTGMYQYHNIGVVTGKTLIEKALLGLGRSDLLSKCSGTSVTLLNTKQNDYYTDVVYSLNLGDELDSEMGTVLRSKTFNYNMSTFAPTVKKSLKHFKIKVNESGIYEADDIVIYSSDVDVNEYSAEGTGHKGVSDKVSIGTNTGVQLLVAFQVYEGFGYEDAIIINEEAVYSGKLASMSYFTISEEIQDIPKIVGEDKTTKENILKTVKFGVPDKHNYDYLDSNGLPKKGSILKVGDIAISRIETTSGPEGTSRPIFTKLKEGSKDKGCVVATSIEEYTKEDGIKYKKASVSFMYVSNPALGTKFSGNHGNKGVVSKIVPACMMPFDIDGNKPDLILNPTGTLPRNNLGQLTEIIKNTLGIKKNAVQLIKPFSELNITEILEDAVLNDVVCKPMYDGVTGQKYDRDILIGYMNIIRSEHDVKGKYNACSLDPALNPNTLAASRGPGGAQRMGEMESWALSAKNVKSYLSEVMTVQGGDITTREKYINHYKNGAPLNLDNHKIDNRLNTNAKVHFFMLGSIFEDFDSGRFRTLTDEEILAKDSPFITTNSYDTKSSEYTIDPNKCTSMSKAERDLEARSFKYARCIDMKKRIIYPEILNSPFMCSNLWYIKSKHKETSPLYSAISKLIYNDFNSCGDGNSSDCEIAKLSRDSITQLLRSKKEVVWLKGMRLPFIAEIGITEKYLEQMNNISNFDMDKAKESIKVFRNYNGILSILLGMNFNVQGGREYSCSKNGSVAESLVFYKCYELLNGSNDKFGVGSYNFGEYYKDLLTLSKNQGATEEDLRKVMEFVDSIENNFEYVQGFLDNFCFGVNSLEGFDDKEFSLSVINNNSLPTKFDLFKASSCSYFWVPPRAFRDNVIDNQESDIQKRINSLVKRVCTDVNNWYTTEVYKCLDDIKKLSVELLTKHSGTSKNSILRDQVNSVRIVGSSRGYITVDPTLSMDEIGIPLAQASGMFKTFLESTEGYPEDSYMYKIMSKLENKYVDEEKKILLPEAVRDLNRRSKEELPAIITTENLERFKTLGVLCGFNEVYDSEVKTSKQLFDMCYGEVIERIRELLDKYLITMNRAPTFWQYSIQTFKGKLRFGCHSIAICPLNCRAFNADFDGDQMSMTIAITEEARKDQQKMLPSKNILNISDGKVNMKLNQDMALGIYWLTIEDKNKLSAEIRTDGIDDKYVVRQEANVVGSYDDFESIIRDIMFGELYPQEYIVYRVDFDEGSQFYKDTAGRIILNALIPDNKGFTLKRRVYSNPEKTGVALVDDITDCIPVDSYCALYTDVKGYKSIKGDTLQDIVNDISGMSQEKVKIYLERVMKLGFDMAHKSGVSLSLFDFKEIMSDKEIEARKEELKKEVDEAKRILDLGFGTDKEYEAYLSHKFQLSDDDFARYLANSIDRYSNLFLLIDSGARGSFQQLVKQCVMVGLPRDAKGNIIPEPIYTPYLSGLESNDYFNSSPFSREACITGALSTAQVGEILRGTVHQSCHNIILDASDDNTTVFRMNNKANTSSDKFCDASAMNIDIKYDVKLPSNFNINECELILGRSDSKEWANMVNEWRQYENNGNVVSLQNLLEELLCKYHIKKIWYRNKLNGLEDSGRVSYKMKPYFKKVLIKRSIDLDGLKMTEYDKGIENSVLKFDGYNVITGKTIERFEEDSVRTVPVYLAMGCTCKTGICKRCYGATDLWQEPQVYDDVGINAAQVIGQHISQLLLDTHKSSGGNNTSGFEIFKHYIRQHHIGDTVFIAKQSGVLHYDRDDETGETGISIINPNGVVDLGKYRITNMDLLKYNNGDFISAGDILYYNDTLNFNLMYQATQSSPEVSNPYDKCRLNLLKELVDLFNCGLSVRHFDVLLRDLTKFGSVTESCDIEGQFYPAGSVANVYELESKGVKYKPVMVSSHKSIQLNERYVTSLALSHLNKQIGNASILSKKSESSPLELIYEGIEQNDIYSENRLSPQELFDKYASRKFGSNINIPVEDCIKQINDIKDNRIVASSTATFKIKKDNRKTGKANDQIKVDKLSQMFDKLKKNTDSKPEEVKTEEVKTEEIKTEEIKTEKKRTRIKLNYNLDGSRKDADNSDLFGDSKGIDVEKTSFFTK